MLCLNDCLALIVGEAYINSALGVLLNLTTCHGSSFVGLCQQLSLAFTSTNHSLCIESLSEAVKLLKADYLVKAINAHKMDQAIIFCRTKLDCDNIEEYLQSMGGGQDTTSGYYQYIIDYYTPLQDQSQW